MSLTKATYSMISAAPINVMDYIPTAQHAAIYDFTSTYDAGQDIQNALDAAAAKQGSIVLFPAGLFNTGQTIDLPGYTFMQGVYGEMPDGIYIIQEFSLGTQIKWIGPNTTDPILRAFNIRMFKLDGFLINGDNKNVKGILLDSDNNPSSAQNEFSRFSIRKCLLGVEWGTGGLATPYDTSGVRFTTFTIWSTLFGSVGFRINSGNASQVSTIESGGIQVDDISIDLIVANLLQIRRVFSGGTVRTAFIRAQLPIDVLVENSSSENWGGRADSKISSESNFLLVVPSVEDPTFPLRDFTMTLIGNQMNNPTRIQAPIRIVDIGGNFGYCYDPSNAIIACTAIVTAAGNGSIVSVMNNGNQTYSGYASPSGWQTSDYVRIVNISPDQTSMFWGIEALKFPVTVSGNNRGISHQLRNPSGGIFDYFFVESTEVGKIQSTNATTLRYYTAEFIFFGTGTGSPEGVISASIGSIWTRTDGGAGTTMYVKESGTGNVGWVAK